MSAPLDPATQAVLDSGRSVDRSMVLFSLGSGDHGFHTGSAPIEYNGVTFNGAGALLSAEGVRQTSDLSAADIVIRVTAIANSGLTPDVLAEVESPEHFYHQRPVYIYREYRDPETGARLSVEPEFAGIIDQIVHEESVDGEAVMAVHCKSRFIDHQRSGYRIRSDADQRRLNPTDDSMRHVMKVQSERVLFGRSDEKPKKPKRKKLFGIF